MTQPIKHPQLTSCHPRVQIPHDLVPIPPAPQALLHSCPPQSHQAPLGKCHASHLPLGRAVIPFACGAPPSYSSSRENVSGPPRPQMPKVTCDLKDPCHFPRQSGCYRLHLAGYPVMPTTLSYQLYFKFLSFRKCCTFLQIVFISRLHYLTPRRCLIHLYEWVC